jgi:hypothetical protein
MEPTETVHFNDLIAVLPTTVDGYECSEPKGQTNSMGDMKMSHAEIDCKAIGTDETVSISVDDWAFHKAVYLPFIMSSRFSQESTDGYSKGIKIGEDPGREEFTYASNRGKRTVLYGKRYNVEIDGRGIEPADLEQWYGLVRKSSLPTQ